MKTCANNDKVLNHAVVDMLVHLMQEYRRI